MIVIFGIVDHEQNHGISAAGFLKQAHHATVQLVSCVLFLSVQNFDYGSATKLIESELSYALLSLCDSPILFKTENDIDATK